MKNELRALTNVTVTLKMSSEVLEYSGSPASKNRTFFV